MSKLDDVYPDDKCEDRDCEEGVHGDNHHCYKATCYVRLRNCWLIKLVWTQEKLCRLRLKQLEWVKEPFIDQVLKDFTLKMV